MVCENIFTAPPRLMVEDGAFSHKIDYVSILKEILYSEGHQHRITGSKVTAILMPFRIKNLLNFLDIVYFMTESPIFNH